MNRNFSTSQKTHGLLWSNFTPRTGISEGQRISTRREYLLFNITASRTCWARRSKKSTVTHKFYLGATSRPDCSSVSPHYPHGSHRRHTEAVETERREGTWTAAPARSAPDTEGWMQWVLHPPPLAPLVSPPRGHFQQDSVARPEPALPTVEGPESPVAGDAAPSASNMEKALGKRKKENKNPKP